LIFSLWDVFSYVILLAIGYGAAWWDGITVANCTSAFILLVWISTCFDAYPRCCPTVYWSI